MLTSAPVPAHAGWAPARASRPPDAQRALLRTALILSSLLHLAAGLLFSHLLRERLEDVGMTLAMRSRVVLLPPAGSVLVPLRTAPPASGGPSAQAGVLVPVRDELISSLNKTLSEWSPVAGPVAASAAAGAPDAGGVDARALPPPPDAAPLAIGAPVDEVPRVTRRVEPTYPSFALEAGLTGRVVLHVLVGTDGRVREIRVAEGSKVFVESAVQAVQLWLFQPARVGKRPVAVWVEIPVIFRQ